MYMMQISKVSFSNEPGTENLLLGASIILATRSRCEGISRTVQEYPRPGNY